jgi:hypothetical protein
MPITQLRAEGPIHSVTNYGLRTLVNGVNRNLCIGLSALRMLRVTNPRASFPNGQKRPSGTPFALGWYIVGLSALRDVAGGELFPFVA